MTVLCVTGSLCILGYIIIGLFVWSLCVVARKADEKMGRSD